MQSRNSAEVSTIIETMFDSHLHCTVYSYCFETLKVSEDLCCCTSSCTSFETVDVQSVPHLVRLRVKISYWYNAAVDPVHARNGRERLEAAIAACFGNVGQRPNSCKELCMEPQHVDFQYGGGVWMSALQNGAGHAADSRGKMSEHTEQHLNGVCCKIRAMHRSEICGVAVVSNRGCWMFGPVVLPRLPRAGHWKQLLQMASRTRVCLR